PLVLDTLAKQLQVSDRQLLVYALASDTNVDTVTAQILAARPSAIIVTSAHLTSSMARACRQHQIKVVLLNRIQHDIRINAVACNYYQCCWDIDRFLLEREIQRISFVGGTSNSSTHRDRARRFHDVLVEVGRSIHDERGGDFSYQVCFT